MTHAPGWKDFRNILCVRPDNMGDVLMTAPAIRALKQAVPGRRITLLASQAGAAIARYIPEIDTCIGFDTPWYKHARAAAAHDVAALVADLEKSRFDAAVIFTVFSQSPLPTALLCYLAGIPRVAAYCRENPYQLISDWIPDIEPFEAMRHEVTRQLELVRGLGAEVQDDSLSLAVPQAAMKSAQSLLERKGLRRGEPWLLLHPGASERKRCYPLSEFRETARRLAEASGYRIVLSGSADERPMADDISAAVDGQAIVTAGDASLDTFIGLVKLAPLLISNNTGAVHIAAATQTPVLVLYALTNPQHAPWKVSHRVLPFDVDEASGSRNVLVRYANRMAFPEPAGKPVPRDIVDAALQMLGGDSCGQLPGELVMTGRRRHNLAGGAIS